MNTARIVSGEVCAGDYHAYPKTYAGSPEYAAEYFSKCLCGRKRKITTTVEVEVDATAQTPLTDNKKR